MVQNLKIVDDIDIENSNISDNRICNFNVIYHRSDIRNNYLNITKDLYYKDNNDIDIDIDINKFPIILKEYLNYLFDDNLYIESTEFYKINI